MKGGISMVPSSKNSAQTPGHQKNINFHPTNSKLGEIVVLAYFLCGRTIASLARANFQYDSFSSCTLCTVEFISAISKFRSTMTAMI